MWRHKVPSPLADSRGFINPLQPSRLANGAANKEHCRISSKVLFRFHVNPIPVAVTYAKWVINLHLSSHRIAHHGFKLENRRQLACEWNSGCETIFTTTISIKINVVSISFLTRYIILELLLFNLDYYLNWNVRTEITKWRDKGPIEHISIIITIIIRSRITIARVNASLLQFFFPFVLASATLRKLYAINNIGRPYSRSLCSYKSLSIHLRVEVGFVMSVFWL